MNRTVLVLAVALLGASLVSCTAHGEPSAAPSVPQSSVAAPSIRQTDDEGRTLPFENPFPNRWSANNDGSAYEPCTQISEALIREFGLDPQSIEDVAASDFQTARGCSWTFNDDGRSSLSQAVGNLTPAAQGLDGYKRFNAAGTTWYPDIEIDGRRVLVGSIASGECTQIVRSGDAAVVTTITRVGFDRPSTVDVCRTVEQFVRSTLPGIPS
ncbi:DUF3558 family protein [Gordonia amicalis]|uniref:DUF3558 family protein n=1 Tax=Gordonia amicalis TaxID=89053 RepID=UPI0024B9DA64|nr:DUF3558 family protein [Gordonia amicalis]MDJ0455337.1 DUF3558 family protein [Gordonia amicalis]MDV7078798.1 DUF3558 family protein [Gordonia amicalis]